MGRWSDNCNHIWGKRIPFLLTGAFGTNLAFLTLAWAGDLGRWTKNLLGFTDAAVVSEIYVILSVFILSLALQPLQCALRALPLDFAPPEQQSHIHGWAGKFSGLGQVFGCAMGVLTVPQRSDSLSFIAMFRTLAITAVAALDST